MDLAGGEGAREVSRLERRAADVVDERQAERDRPVGVDHGELARRELGRVAQREAEAAHAQPEPPEDERDERGERRRRQLHADRREDLAQRLEPLFEAAAAQELVGRAALEIASLRSGRPLRGAPIGRGRARALPAVRERVAEPLVERTRVLAHRGAVLDRDLVPLRRAIERERAAARPPRRPREPRPARRHPRRASASASASASAPAPISPARLAATCSRASAIARWRARSVARRAAPSPPSRTRS